MRKMSDKIDLLIERMDRLIRVIALDTIKGREPHEQVILLSQLDYAQSEIADITGMTQGNVSKIIKKTKLKKVTRPSTIDKESMSEKPKTEVHNND